jgi:hypothetical protein
LSAKSTERLFPLEAERIWTDPKPEGMSRGRWHKKFSSDLCRLIDTLYQRRSKIRDLITAFRESSRNPFPNWVGN